MTSGLKNKNRWLTPKEIDPERKIIEGGNMVDDDDEEEEEEGEHQEEYQKKYKEINMTTNEKDNKFVSSFKGVLDALTETTIKMSEIAYKGPTLLSAGLGAVIVIVALGLKILKYDIDTTVFVSMLATGWLFLGMASLLKFLQYKDQYNMKKMIWLIGQKQVETLYEQQHQSMKDAQKKTDDILGEEKFNV